MSKRTRYDAVYSFRKSLMEDARRDYLEAKRAVDHCFDQIEKNNQLVKETREKVESSLGQVSMSEINYCNQFIKSVALKNDQLRIEVRSLLVESDKKYEIFLEAQIEKKVVEKLIEKDKLRMKKEKIIKENKKMEDMQIMRSQRRVS